MLKLQYFGHLMWRANSLEKIQMLGKTTGSRRRGWQWMRRLDGIIGLVRHEFEQTPGDSEGQARLVCCGARGCRVRHDEWLTFRYNINQIPCDYSGSDQQIQRIISDRQSAWRTMDRGLYHCIGGSDQNHPKEKEMQEGKMVAWGGLTNS